MNEFQVAELRDALAANTASGSDLFRLKVTGHGAGATKWLTVDRETVERITVLLATGDTEGNRPA